MQMPGERAAAAAGREGGEGRRRRASLPSLRWGRVGKGNPRFGGSGAMPPPLLLACCCSAASAEWSTQTQPPACAWGRKDWGGGGERSNGKVLLGFSNFASFRLRRRNRGLGFQGYHTCATGAVVSCLGPCAWGGSAVIRYMTRGHSCARGRLSTWARRSAASSFAVSYSARFPRPHHPHQWHTTPFHSFSSPPKKHDAFLISKKENMNDAFLRGK